jgi:hypothetical protein
MKRSETDERLGTFDDWKRSRFKNERITLINLKFKF